MGEAPEPEDDETALVLHGSRRAAVALEDAGELRAAARLFEYVGEHGQAAALRLELASTLQGGEARVQALREGAARIGGGTPQGRELHRSLAHELVELASGLPPGARRRALVLEAAQSYESADEGERAGQIYEHLGLLRRAERAYRAAGALEAYEAVLATLEDAAQAKRDREQLQHSIDEALREGRRRQAAELMREHVQRSRAEGRTPRAHIARELAELETRTPRAGSLEFRYVDTTGPARTRVITSPQLRIGRAPGLELTVEAPAVSRRHLVLRLDREAHAAPDRAACVHAEDLGSRAGSFFDGEALLAGEPIPLDIPGELALGIAATWSWLPNEDASGGLLGPIEGAPSTWLLFAPAPSPLRLRPELTLPAQIRSAGDFVELGAAEHCAVELQGRPLGPGATVELLTGDRLILRFDGSELLLEVGSGGPTR